MMDPREAERNPIYMVAADWLVRLRQPDLSLSDTLSWQRWMDQDPRHRQAFRDLEEVWEKVGAVPAPPRPDPQALREDSYDGSLSVSVWTTRDRSAFRAWRRPVWWAAAAIILLTLGGIGLGSLLIPPALTALPKGRIFETAVGQNATVGLSDGSEVQLGGRTRISVSLGPHLREVDLLTGEAFFVVAKDRARPFKVRAGSATVTAVGTEFNVRRSDDRVTVSVLEGRVLVQPMAPLLPIAWLSTSHAVGSAEALSSGQRSTVTRRGTESTQAVGDASSAVAWQHGRLAFEAEPLRYVVQDVNRYAHKPIVIADERTGDLRVTGTVAETNIMGWVGSLEAAFGLHADIQADQIILRQQ